MNLPNWITGNEKPPQRVVEYIEGYMRFFAGMTSLSAQQTNMPDIYTGAALKMVKELEFMYEGAPKLGDLNEEQYNELVSKISHALRAWKESGWIQVPEVKAKQGSPSPANLAQLLQQAIGEMSAKKFDQALPRFKEILQIDPNNIVGCYGSGYCSFYLQDFNEAESYFSRALQLTPRHSMEQQFQEVTRFKYGQTLRRVGKLPESIDVLKPLFQETPNDYAIVQELVIALNNNEQYTEALNVLSEARKHQTNPEILKHMDVFEKANKERVEIDIR
jgi:tetratricopeptide (TPR) repeat protein